MDIFTAFGLSASAGLNAYIPLLVVSLVAKFTNLIQLNSPWDTLESWWIIGLLVVLSIIEFFADKIPAVNHVNDVVQSFIRPAAGAIVFAASSKVIADIHPVLAMAAGLLVAGSVHAVKSLAVRPAVSATTAGIANPVVSVFEDIISTIVSILSIVLPVFIATFTVVIILWIIVRLYRRSNRYYSV